MHDASIRQDIRVAESYLKADRRIPLDLYARLLEAGVDVEELERRTN